MTLMKWHMCMLILMKMGNNNQFVFITKQQVTHNMQEDACLIAIGVACYTHPLRREYKGW